MTRKEAHQRKDLSTNIYGRSSIERWYNDYTDAQMSWLWEHGHIEYSEPMVHLGERPEQKYIAFTPKGRRWNDWYSMPTWFWFKYKVLRYGYLKYKWHSLRIACGHKYEWMNY